MQCEVTIISALILTTMGEILQRDRQSVFSFSVCIAGLRFTLYIGHTDFRCIVHTKDCKMLRVRIANSKPTILYVVIIVHKRETDNVVTRELNVRVWLRDDKLVTLKVY